VSTGSEDAFFSILTAAAVVPWAARTDPAFATAICAHLPHNVTTAAQALALGLPPDLVSVVLATAVAHPQACASAPANLTAVLFRGFQAHADDVNVHVARSLAFVLAGSPSLGFLRDQLLPATAALADPTRSSQLRAPDRVALLQRVLLQGPSRHAVVRSAVAALADSWQQLQAAGVGGSTMARLFAAVLSDGALLSTPPTETLPAFAALLPDAVSVSQQHQLAAAGFDFAFDALQLYSE